jgi:tetratricopeptide (TPR) repeat protein
LLNQGKWANAMPLLREALDRGVRLLGPEHPYVVVSLFNWATLLHAEGRLTEAEKHFRRALALTDDREKAASINLKLGAVELDKGNNAVAEQLDQRALDMYTELKGPDALVVALPLIELAEVRMSLGDHHRSEHLARRALEIRRKKLPADHPDLAQAELQLGRALIAQGRAAEAEPLLQRAVQFVRNPPFPLPDWMIGEAESALGSCALMLGRRSEGQTLLRSAQSKLASHPRPLFRRGRQSARGM